MAVLGSAANFEGGTLYSSYRRYPFYAERAAWVRSIVPTGKVLVAGCGWGYLVDELVALGLDAWGIDASTYCVGRAVVSSRVLTVEATSRNRPAGARTAAGLGGSTKFAAAVTDDLLPCLTDAEASTALAELRRVATTLLHIVTPGAAADPAKAAGLNWKSHAAWKSFVGTDLVYSAEGKAVL